MPSHPIPPMGLYLYKIIEYHLLTSGRDTDYQESRVGKETFDSIESWKVSTLSGNVNINKK